MDHLPLRHRRLRWEFPQRGDLAAAQGQSIAFPGSHCPSCGRPIRWYDNIPLVSYLVLRGKCRFCKCTISPRYLLIELTTALLVAGLYICYFVADIRTNTTGGLVNDAVKSLLAGRDAPATKFLETWPMFMAHAALLCGLLACAAVDMELWLVPLEITWVVAAIGVASATYLPHPWMAAVSPTTAAMGFAAAIGLATSVMLLRLGFIRPSFAGVAEKPLEEPPREKKAGPGGKKTAPAGKPAKAKPLAVAITAEDGVSPRKEILREVIFLAPAIILAAAANLILSHVPAANRAWQSLFGPGHPQLALHLSGAAAAVFGYLLGGALIWGTRILGTLAFGKEAMGLGDVHILACVGAVTGWIVPIIAFLVAPVIGLLWAGYLFFGRKHASCRTGRGWPPRRCWRWSAMTSSAH